MLLGHTFQKNKIHTITVVKQLVDLVCTSTVSLLFLSYARAGTYSIYVNFFPTRVLISISDDLKVKHLVTAITYHRGNNKLIRVKLGDQPNPTYELPPMYKSNQIKYGQVKDPNYSNNTNQNGPYQINYGSYWTIKTKVSDNRGSLSRKTKEI